MPQLGNTSVFLRKSTIYRIFYSKIDFRRPVSSTAACRSDKQIQNEPISDDSQSNDAILEDELVIEKMRNKHRLPEHVYNDFVKKVPLRPEFKTDILRMSRLKLFYGRYGKGSGLNPGLMWPTRQEVDDLLAYEAQYEPTPQETLRILAEENAELQKQRDEFEVQVERNMEKLDQYIGDYYKRISKKETDAVEAKKKRATLIEEISEYLGYDVDPADPKFKEAVEQKHKEKKRAQKEKKAQESYSKMLDKLAEIAEK